MKQTIILSFALFVCSLLSTHVRSIPVSTLSLHHDRDFLFNMRGGGKKVTPVAVRKDGPLQVFVNTVKESKRHLAAAAAARSVSIFGMFPVGKLKQY